MNYFFDSYAIIESLKSNPNYAPFKDESVVTTAANLGEVCYYALRTGQLNAYESAMKRIKPELLAPERADWEGAAQVKFENREKKMSLVDGLGYFLAKKNQLDFLTGDRAFKNMPNVKWIV